MRKIKSILEYIEVSDCNNLDSNAPKINCLKPCIHKDFGSSCIVVGKKSSNYTGKLLFSGLSGDSMVWQRDHQI